MITKKIDKSMPLIQLIKNVFDTVQSAKDIVLEMGQYHSTLYIEDVPLTKRIHFNFADEDLTKVETYVMDFTEDDKTQYEETLSFESHNTKGLHDEIMKTFDLNPLPRLDVEFRNVEHDRLTDPDLDQSVYHRLEKCWNVYFHGFMDAHDDIAYVLKPTTVEPGIYEVDVYGEAAMLYLWNTGDEHHRPLKGLIARKSDAGAMTDAKAKYSRTAAFI